MALSRLPSPPPLEDPSQISLKPKAPLPLSTKPIETLSAIFAIRTLLISAIVTLTPSSYDTSASLLLLPSAPQNRVQDFLQKLASWDAVYFVKIAERGYANEQEWAFGWGYTRILGVVGRIIGGVGEFLGGKNRLGLGEAGGCYEFVLAGIILSVLAHYCSVFALCRLTREVFPSKHQERLAVTASVLHILSPAGIFLYAPAPESLFSFLNFAGALTFAMAWGSSEWKQVGNILLTGLLWGISCTIRSNGIMNGVIVLLAFTYDGLNMVRTRSFGMTARWIAWGIAGLTVGAGMVGPQVLAWRQYCSSAAAVQSSWCEKPVPSIYTYVQEHYWNVGFLRYWTPGNIPLFLLAAPMLAILLRSSLFYIRTPIPAGQRPSTAALLALPQFIIAALAISNYHVQIVLRLCSGYAAWYWWVAAGFERKEAWAERVAWGMVVYAGVQAVLYAGFLPPA